MPQATATHTAKAPPATACGDVAELTRLRYFHGRALSALDLRREQSYHLEKARLRNRLLHGWGIVCGLDVGPCQATTRRRLRRRRRRRSWSSPGAAIDCHGNEIVVRNPREVALEDAAERRRAGRGCGAAPGPSTSRSATTSSPSTRRARCSPAECEPVAGCEYGRVCETYRICASTTRPDRRPGLRAVLRRLRRRLPRARRDRALRPDGSDRAVAGRTCAAGARSPSTTWRRSARSTGCTARPTRARTRPRCSSKGCEVRLLAPGARRVAASAASWS